MDETRCREKVLDRWNAWPTYHQCERKAAKDGFCTQHHPDTVAARQATSAAKGKAAFQKRLAEWRAPQLLAALVKIRDGDNDPRGTAAWKGWMYDHD